MIHLRLPAAVSSAVAVLLLVPIAPAQIVGGQWAIENTYTGTMANEEFGSALAALGDLNGDGLREFAVGAPLSDPGGIDDAGSVWVYDGASRQLLFQLTGLDGGDQFGFAVADAGDVNGDGISDIIVGAPYEKVGVIQAAGTARVFSGADQSVLITINGDERYALLGFAVDGMGDVNGDGYSDLAVGEPWSEPFGYYRGGSGFIFDGVTGAVLFQTDAPKDGWYWASAIANAGDVDGDGINDVIVGGTFADIRPTGHDNSGLATVFSGATGAVVFHVRGQKPMDMMGNAVDGLGDVDGDGLSDVVVGAYLVKINNKPGAGATYLISSSGQALVRFEGERVWERNGWCVANAGDLDGDGINDILSSGHTADTDHGIPGGGKVYVYSGRTYETLFTIQGDEFDGRLGYRSASLGDLNGDSVPEIAISAHMADSKGVVDSGAVTVRSFSRCISTTGSEIYTSVGGTIDVTLDFPASEAGYSYALLGSATGMGPVNLGGVAVPLTGDSLYQQTRAGTPPPFMQNAYGVLDANGDATSQVVCPPNGMAPLVGSTLFLAGVSYQQPGLVRKATTAAAVRILL